MINLSKLAIIGSGPTAIFVLHSIWKHVAVLKTKIDSITIFEKERFLGMGMPYNPNTTDIYNLANISSEEIPKLPQSFSNWLRQQEVQSLKSLNINELPIEDSEVYSRVALGQYFCEQYNQLLKSLKLKGIRIIEQSGREVVDISKLNDDEICIYDSCGALQIFSVVVIANGHVWKDTDRPDSGYFATPWPIHKLLPKKDIPYNFPIGILGASLSAFDVVTSLSHRHGQFKKRGGNLEFIENKEAAGFKLILHSAEGWLPHLQYAQEEPMREIYRHFKRKQLMELLDKDGFLRIEDYFNMLCRPALIAAFVKDDEREVVERLKDDTFNFRDFVELMSVRHEYVNSFEGMRQEMIAAKNCVENNRPVHWMETLDDLMYSINYHAELLPAEDHLFFHKEVMAFLMNVIAALPLQSANILLALYDAGSIEIKVGKVTVQEEPPAFGNTRISVKSENGRSEILDYALFVNCAGQRNLRLEDYFFPSLVNEGTIRSPSAKFASLENVNIAGEQDNVIKKDGAAWLVLSGIDIDSAYRTIDKNGRPNNDLFDINFAHTSGLRPYSYGLQACNATSMIMVESWIAQIMEGRKTTTGIEEITELYEENDEL